MSNRACEQRIHHTLDAKTLARNRKRHTSSMNAGLFYWTPQSTFGNAIVYCRAFYRFDPSTNVTTYLPASQPPPRSIPKVPGAIRGKSQQSRLPQNDGSLSDSCWKPPKCKYRGGRGLKEEASEMEDKPIDKMDTTAYSGKGWAQPLREQYDAFPDLDDEREGGLRRVSRSVSTL